MVVMSRGTKTSGEWGCILSEDGKGKEDKWTESKKRTKYKYGLSADVTPIQHICSSLALVNPLSAIVMQHFALSAHLEHMSG